MVPDTGPRAQTAQRPARSAGRTPTVAALAIAQTLTWAGMYYMFPALLPHWERALGWSKAELTGAFTASLLVSAASAPLVGRLIDRGHGQAVLSASALLGGLLVGLLSQVREPWQFYAVWLALGVAMSGALYEACFAHLTRLMGSEARAVITALTLVAGFAGSVSFPAAHLLAGAYDWRVAALVFAAWTCLLASPLMWFGSRSRGLQPSGGSHAPPAPAPGALRRAARAPAFWLLAGGFAMVGLNHGVLITHLLPLLAERGVPAAVAVSAAALIGPMQVVGRVAMLSVERRLSATVLCVLSFAFLATASGVLFGAGALPGLVFLFVALQGSGYGVTSILRPVITAEYLGRAGFGVVSGAQATAFLAAFAAAPTLAALLWAWGGYALVNAACVGVALLGLSCLLGAARLSAQPR